MSSQAEISAQANALADKLHNQSGGADTSFADEILRRLSISLGGSFQQTAEASPQRGALAFREPVSQGPMQDPYHSLRDEVSITSSDLGTEGEGNSTYLDDSRSRSLTRSRISSQMSPSPQKTPKSARKGGKTVSSLAEWEEMHNHRKQRLHDKQLKRDDKKLAVMEAEAREREEERAMMEAMAKRVLQKKNPKLAEEKGSEITTLKKWRDTFGSRLDQYDAQKKNKFKKLQKQINEAQAKKEEKARPPKLKMNEDTGKPVWDDNVPCPVESVQDILTDDRDVTHRLMKQTKKKVRNHIKSQEKAKKEQAMKELEECYFEPQIKSGRRVPKFPSDVRNPKRQLGYEPKPYYGKAQRSGVEYTFTPQINDKSREMVDPRAYASTDDVCRRLAKPGVAQRRAGAAISEDDVSDAREPGAKDFIPSINKRSDDMARDVNVFDRLYNIGMQQMLEKRRLQSEFWENYTRLEHPHHLNMPPQAFDPYSQTGGPDSSSFGATQQPQYDDSYGMTPGMGGMSGMSGAGMTATPGGVTSFDGSTAPGNDTLTPGGYGGESKQNLSLGMSAAEFLAMYSGR